jgi:predicted kinase
MMTLHIVFGPQGAGKTSLSRNISNLHKATVFSIDEWMSALYLPDMPQPIDLGWITSRVGRCQQRIWETASDIVRHGGAAVLDLGMQTLKDRAAVRSLIETHQLSATWYFVTAPATIRRERVVKRNAEKNATFAFEVTPQMFEFMEGRFEEPTGNELASCNLIDTSVKEKEGSQY